MNHKRKFYSILLLTLILQLAIAGCGKGGSGGSDGSGSTSAVSDVTAGAITLTWDPPTTNADGTSLTDLAGYKIYYGTSSGNYTGSTDVGSVTTFSTDSIPLASGTWCFAVTAYDTSRNESDYSNEVCADI